MSFIRMFLTLAAISAGLGFSPAKAAVVLQTDASGELLGATGVAVAGSIYDVVFVDLSCIAEFDGCDDVSDFTFQDEPSAVLASQALLDQVLLDVAQGDFDTDHTLTFGCNLFSQCNIYTPYGLFSSGGLEFVDAAIAHNVPEEIGDHVTFVSTRTNNFLNSNAGSVWASWSPAQITPPVSVPEPGSLALTGLAFVGLLVGVFGPNRRKYMQ